MKITAAELMSQEDGAALTAHPEQTLKSGEQFVCSCGETRTTIRISGAPVSSWCPSCGDTARWEPSHSPERQA